MTAVQSHEAYVGLRVVWMHVPRGGYGYVVPVEAKIVEINLQGDRAVIEVMTRAGAKVRRNVLTKNMRHVRGPHDAARRGTR